MIVIDPVATPAPPKPAINRPTMNIEDEVAAPHITDPTSNMRKKTKYVHCFD
jgi:hypothetical protein